MRATEHITLSNHSGSSLSFEVILAELTLSNVAPLGSDNLGQESLIGAWRTEQQHKI